MICIRSQIFLGMDSHILVQNTSLHLKGSHYYSDEPMKKEDTAHGTGRQAGRKVRGLVSLDSLSQGERWGGGSVTARLFSEQLRVSRDCGEQSLGCGLLYSKQ